MPRRRHLPVLAGDREHRTLTVLADRGHGWDVLPDLDEAGPTGMVPVGSDGALGEVALDLNELLAT